MAGRSENLTHHHGSDGGKHSDAQGGQGVLPLGHGHGGDHTGTQAGDAELADDVVLAAHRDRIG